MKKSTVIAFAAFAGMAACAAPPSSPEESAARKAAAMRYSATQCTAYMGGISGIQDVLKAANRQEDKARQLGASDALIEKANRDVKSTWDFSVAMVGERDTCSDAMSSIATVMIEEG